MLVYNIIPDHSYLAVLVSTGVAPLGSQACRALLKVLQNKLALSGDLNETDFPYYFMDSNQTIWYVCFSHSKRSLAVLLSKSAQIGIDIEDRAISQTVAQRYFAVSEIDWLEQCGENQQETARRLLWMLKESYIKTQLDLAQLFSGLGKNITELVTTEILDSLLESDDDWVVKKVKDWWIGFLPQSNCAFIIKHRLANC